MVDIRDTDDPIAALAALQKRVDDLETTLMTRTARSPTGDLEVTMRTTAKSDTILAIGQTLNRADYPVLFQWVIDQGLLGLAGLFGTGDGSTTFTAPNFKDRVPIGAGALALGALVGANSYALLAANLPSHKHNVSVADHAQHNHGFLTAQGGAHGYHVGQNFNAAGGGVATITADNAGNSSGTHNHSGTTAFGSVDSHSVTESNIGSGTAIDMRQAGIALNWLIYT
jgi:microcystin-dependent protein